MDYYEYRKKQMEEWEAEDKRFSFQMKWGWIVFFAGIVIATILGIAIGITGVGVTMGITALIELMIMDS